MHKIFCSVALGALVLSCSGKKESGDNKAQANAPKMEKVEYIYHDGTRDLKVTITTPPQRAALFTPHMTEMLLALGLGDRIVVGTTEGPVSRQFEKEYEKVPDEYKFIGHSFKMTKEAFLLREPDFVSSDGDLSSESTGSPEELLAQGIAPFTPKTIQTPNATIETVYEDFYMLGKIFNVNDKAKEVVEGMKSKLAEAKKTFVVKPENEKKKVMILSSINNGIWVFSSLAADLVRQAGGVNIYEDAGTAYEFVSFESVVHRNPDVIFITDTQSRNMTPEEKANFIKNHPILKDINAVKNNQIYEVNFADVSPGVRNVDFIIRLNKVLYQGGK